MQLYSPLKRHDFLRLAYSHPDKICKFDAQMIVSLVWSGEAAATIESTGDVTSTQCPAFRQNHSDPPKPGKVQNTKKKKYFRTNIARVANDVQCHN